MKKLLAAILSVMLILPTAVVPFTASADETEPTEVVYFEENFDSPALVGDTVDDSGEPLDTPAEYQTIRANGTFNGWTRAKATSNTDDSVFRIVPDASKTPAGQSLYVSRSATANSDSAQLGFSKTFTNEIDRTKPVTISFRFKRSSAQNATSIGVGGIWLTIDGYGSNGSAARIYGANAMSGTAKTLTITPNVWHNMEYIADCVNSTYVLNILDDEKNVLSTVSGSLTLGAANTTATIRTIRSAYFGKNESTEFDDIKIYYAAPPDPYAVYDADLSPKVSGIWRKQLSLPQTSLNGTSVEWSSEDFYIEFNSQITAEENVKTGTLKATIKNGDETVCERTYKTTLIPEFIYFYENFEYASSVDWTGYNDWAKTYYSGNSNAYMKPYFSEITSDSGNMVGRLYKKVAPAGDYSDIVMTKSFENTSTDSAYSVKLKFKPSNNSNTFRVELGNNASSVSFLFDLSNSRRIFQTNFSNSYIVGYIPTGKNTTGEWHTIEFLVDALGNNKFSLKYDDVTVVENMVYLDNKAVSGAITKLSVGAIKTNWGGVGADVLFDDITVSKSEAEFDPYLITGFSFKDAGGNLCKNAEAGGTVSGIVMKNFKEGDHKGIVAVYDGNRLFDLASFDTKNVVNGETLELTGLNIPDDITNLDIKAYIWDGFAGAGLKPLIQPKEYVWSKVKLYVAGDSIAEPVAANAVRGGWSDYIGSHFDSEQVEAIEKTSVGGMTATVALTDSQRFPVVVNNGSFGDYVLISYAHNDDGKNHTIAQYKTSLETMVDRARSKNITPVFVTSIARRGTVEDNGSQTDTTPNTAGHVFMDYVNAMKEVAEAKNVALIDLNAAFIPYYQEMKAAGLLGGSEWTSPDGITTIADCLYVLEDGTHPTKKAAQWLADKIVELIQASTHPSLAGLKTHILPAE